MPRRHWCSDWLSTLSQQASDAKAAVAEQLHRACLETGFFYVKNHGALRCFRDCAV